jgi:hypothetical protein
MPVQALVIAVALVLALALARVVWVWRKYHGRRVIQCPENLRPAGVDVDAGRAAVTALFKGPELRLSSCTRWPEKAGCGQQCLSQIAASPGGCLVRNILAEWYRGKACASCGREFGEIEWTREPALLNSDKVSLEWKQVPADKLHQVLAASAPLCFACHMANRLVREHPELVVDRSPRTSI